MTEGKYTFEVKRLRDQMVAVATRYLDDRDEAEDITQDALLKLWAMRKKLQDSDVDRLSFTILKHLCVDELRRRGCRKGNRTVDIDSVEIAMELDNPQEIEERERQLMIAVNKLPSKQRLLLQMRYLKGMKPSAIAEIVGGSEDSINMALSRARNGVYKLMVAVTVVAICIGLFPLLVNNTGKAPAIAHNSAGTCHQAQEAANSDSTCAGNTLQEVATPETQKTVKPKLRLRTKRRFHNAEDQRLFEELTELYKNRFQELDVPTDYKAVCDYAEKYFEELFDDTTIHKSLTSEGVGRTTCL